jgi:N-acetylmuramoyl-L-alanine amidase
MELLFYKSLRLSVLALILLSSLGLGPCMGQSPGPETTVNGRPYISLPAIGEQFGMSAGWLEKDKRARLHSQWTQLDFEIHKRDFYLNGVRVWLGDPVAKVGTALYLSTIDLEKTLRPLLTPQVFKPLPALRRIVIDPGHGGKDAGAERFGLQEKTIVMDVSTRLLRRLRKQGFEVYLTRTKDEFIELASRPAISNQRRADFFISIHANAVGNPSIQGVETFILTAQDQPSSGRAEIVAGDRKLLPGNRFDAWNALSGFYLQRDLVRATGSPDRGLKRARFAVLRDLQSPGVLVELGFLSNPGEGRKMGTAAYREKLAEALENGILAYQKTLLRIAR